MDPEQVDDELLDRVASAITDGKPIDWDAVGSRRGEIARRLAHLRAIEAIAGVYRDPAAADHTIDAESADAATGVPLFAWGPLQVLDKLGSGAFGDVYRAFDPALQREVALKLRREGAPHDARETKQFLDEARRLARIRHENVLVVHGADTHEGRVGLWTDLVRGRTLQDLIAEHGPMGPHEAALVGVSLCRALAALHAAHLVHRDLKASNVMREQGGRIVLMDFGCAWEVDSQARKRVGIAGTPATMAPELLLSGAAPSPASDLYSLGVLLYWLVSGRYPTNASSLDEMVEKHRRGASVPLRDVRADLPTAFVRIIERATAAEPSQRYPSAGEMERDLARDMGRTWSAGKDPMPSSDPRRRTWLRRRRRWAVAAVAIVLLAVGAMAVRARLPLRADATLFRYGPNGAEPLTAGSRIGPGDRLYLEIEGSRRMHVYVLNEAANGERFVLFPAEEHSTAELAPGIRHRLPPPSTSNRQRSWLVTSAGGQETIVVVAASQPLPDLEIQIADYPRAIPDRRVAASRGVGGVVEEPGVLLGDLLRLHSKGAWIWQIQVRNSGG